MPTRSTWPSRACPRQRPSTACSAAWLLACGSHENAARPTESNPIPPRRPQKRERSHFEVACDGCGAPRDLLCDAAVQRPGGGVPEHNLC
eukprot:3950439-Prymnesium_polylepis.1